MIKVTASEDRDTVALTLGAPAVKLLRELLSKAMAPARDGQARTLADLSDAVDESAGILKLPPLEGQ